MKHLWCVTRRCRTSQAKQQRNRHTCTPNCRHVFIKQKVWSNNNDKLNDESAFPCHQKLLIASQFAYQLTKNNVELLDYKS